MRPQAPRPKPAHCTQQGTFTAAGTTAEHQSLTRGHLQAGVMQQMAAIGQVQAQLVNLQGLPLGL